MGNNELLELRKEFILPDSEHTNILGFANLCDFLFPNQLRNMSNTYRWNNVPVTLCNAMILPSHICAHMMVLRVEAYIYIL